ncbi:MAG: hypothetical protein Q4E45_00205 [Eubacteriales bacterium]|nr:hypothetical protein [Eubacteriales bacterium]
MQNQDFENREELVRRFEEGRKAACAAAQHSWEEVHVSMGIAVYDPELDRSVSDTARRAGKIMYLNKRREKAAVNPQLFHCQVTADMVK